MKIKLGIFFGGQSVEHEIAVITYSQALTSIDKEKYEVVPIYISKQGLLYTGEDLFELESFKDMDVLLKRCYPVTIVNTGKTWEVTRVHPHLFSKKVLNTIDVAFPIVHGTNCEDGTVAGYLNLLGIPYVGPDILASSIGMDKILMKKVAKESGLPVVDYVSFYSSEYVADEEKILKEIAEKLRYPLIVKPGNLGSSVGIKKVREENQLSEAIEYAMEFSDRIIVEEAVQNLKEINCSVIGNLAEGEASVCEEPWFSDEILSYADKYLGGEGSKSGKGMKGGKVSVNGKMQGTKGPVKGMAASKKKLPADISDEKSKEIQELAKKTFKVLGCSGVARIDFLMDTKSNKVYVNEINTIPGALSYYLWEASGKTFEEEIDELVNIALRRNQEKEKLTFSYDQNILAMQGGTKGSKGAKGKKIMEYENDDKYKAIDKYVKEKLSENRYMHSISVMNRALEFAKQYGANEQDAIYAGLIHDVAKEVPKNQRVLLAEELGIELDEIEKEATALIHAKIGAYIAKHTFNLKDEICNAVETHTTGCANMTLLQKIIYLADFTSEDRSFEGASEVYELAKKNIDEALIHALKLSITDVMNEGGFVHPKGIEAYNYLMLNKRK